MRLSPALGLAWIALLLAGCVSRMALPGPPVQRPIETSDSFVMPDGARLPYRAWLPRFPPLAVVLALHGFNDSRDAWEIPAPDFAAAGLAVYAPDQRGFGAAPGRGLWPGGQALVDDARTMATLLRARRPGLPLILMGESMGAAVLMRLATGPDPPQGVAGYVLVAPAVWGRARMNLLMRGGLWLLSNLVPGLTVTGGFLRVRASDNIEAIRRLSTDPLTIKATRWDTIAGLVNLMDSALAAAPRLRAPTLVLYGGKDQVVPPEATEATWRALPHGAVRAFYPQGFHLLLRDLDRGTPIGDVLAWIANPEAALPSGAETAAALWLAGRH